jgi:hypothetical protein
LDGKPATEPTYREWLNSVPPNVQREVLGATRYKMWKDGEVSPDSFFSDDGRVLTLAQLQEKGMRIPENYRRYIK